MSVINCIVYKVHYNLLPVKTKFREYSLDNDTCCYFCLVGPESIHHIFGTCEKLKVLWKIATETVSSITPYNFDFYNFRRNLCLDLVPVDLPSNNHNFERLFSLPKIALFLHIKKTSPYLFGSLHFRNVCKSLRRWKSCALSI